MTLSPVSSFAQTTASNARPAETLLARMVLTLMCGPLGRPFAGLPVRLPMNALMAFLKRRHPGLFERLAEMGDAEVLIDPTDMPACLAMRLGPSPGLKLVGRNRCDPATTPAATIRGQFAILLELLEGRIDGDALFFSRDLVIEGDTEIVVALRNAVDSEEINLQDDLQAALGPLGRLVPPAREHVTRVLDLAIRARAAVSGAQPARLSERL